MAELEWDVAAERPSLRRAVRHALRRHDASIRVVAEGFMSLESKIDLLAVGGEGELISIRIGGLGEDAEALTRTLADLAWLRPRTEDLLKLSPGLGIEPSIEPRALLICPDFQAETKLAVENFPSRTIDLVGYRCFRERGQLSVLLESRSSVLAEWADPACELPIPGRSRATAKHRESARPSRLTDPPNPSGFRTGLKDTDLRPSIEGIEAID